jgi:hypothetical protein
VSNEFANIEAPLTTILTKLKDDVNSLLYYSTESSHKICKLKIFMDYIKVVSDLEKGNPGLELSLLHLPLAALHLKARPLVLDNINIILQY